MTFTFDLPGVISHEELEATAAHLIDLQLPNGMIPWFPGGHCDPWNHVESAMALDVAQEHAAAMAAYRWLVDTQRPDGSWHNYYRSDGTVEEAKLDTNVCAYIAAGAWHHYLCTSSLPDAAELWPAVDSALGFVRSLCRDDGLPLWAIEPDERPWDYALITGSSSIQHSLRCGARLADVLGVDRSEWVAAADVIAEGVRARPDAFEPKTRWAMDWYYPVLTGVLTGEEAKARLYDGWDTFVMEGYGIRCVSDEQWITASETAECALAFTAIGDTATGLDLLRWSRTHRRDNGSYWTGIVYPRGELFPPNEHTSYTAAAVVLAADAISRTSPASGVFVPELVVD